MLSNIQATIKNATFSPEAQEAEKQEMKEQERLYSTFKQKLDDFKDKIINEQGKGIDSTYDESDIEYLLNEINNNISWLRENRKSRYRIIEEKYNRFFESVFITNLEYRNYFFKTVKGYKQNVERIVKNKKKDEELSPFENEYINLVKSETDKAYKWAISNRLKADKGDYKLQMQNLVELIGRDGEKKLNEKVNKEVAEKNKFDGYRLTKKIFSIFGIVLLIGLIIGFGLMGTSLAMNLNAYRTFYFRLFYMIYGSIFSFFVISYVFLYLKFWLGKRIPYFSFIPLFETPFSSNFMNDYFGWLTFIPNYEDLDYLANTFWCS